MKKRTKIILYLIFALIIWSIVAIYVTSNPIPKEPENVPSEAWSHYNDRSPFEVFLIKNRDAILVILFLISVVPDLVLLITDYRK